MPLSFRSKSHGEIAFGFFNIESDMLLLENHFFFADDFSRWMGTLAMKDDKELKTLTRTVYIINNPDDAGDLMGAIHGIRFTGFIGKIYTIFPFPGNVENFKQNPLGFRTRDILIREIEKFSEPAEFTIDFTENNQVGLGPYLFDTKDFHELIRYVWQGGMPRWKDGIRPDYVLDMKEKIMKTRNNFFKGLF